MTSETTLAVLEAAINKDPLSLKEALNIALSERIAVVLDEARSSIFEAKDDEDEDEEDEEDEEDDDEEDDEELDEELIVTAVESILEAAENEGIELSEEELAELSKKTLNSYLVKSHAARKKARSSERYHYGKAWQASFVNGDEDKHDAHVAKADKAHTTANKRAAGINIAAKKLHKENTDLT